MTSFRQIIAKWPSMQELAADMGVPYQTAAAWKARNHIPPKYWPALISKAAERAIEGVSFALLAELSAEKSAEAAA